MLALLLPLLLPGRGVPPSTPPTLARAVSSAAVSRAPPRSCRDGGSISHLAFKAISLTTRLSNPVWWGAAEPIYVTALPRAPGIKARCPPAALQPCVLPCRLRRAPTASQPPPTLSASGCCRWAQCLTCLSPTSGPPARTASSSRAAPWAPPSPASAVRPGPTPSARCASRASRCSCPSSATGPAAAATTAPARAMRRTQMLVPVPVPGGGLRGWTARRAARPPCGSLAPNR